VGGGAESGLELRAGYGPVLVNRSHARRLVMVVQLRVGILDATFSSSDVSTDRHLHASATWTWAVKSRHIVQGRAGGCRYCTGGTQSLDDGSHVQMSGDWAVVVPALMQRQLVDQCCVQDRWDCCYCCGCHCGKMQCPRSSWRRSGAGRRLVSLCSNLVQSEKWAWWAEASCVPCRATPSCLRRRQRQ
jgi:hypothetical protein